MKTINSKMKKNTKKQYRYYDTNTTTWTNIWKIANSIQKNVKKVKIMQANFMKIINSTSKLHEDNEVLLSGFIYND